MTARWSAAVFDLGGVLIDWNPRYLYRKLFQREADMEYFLANICTPEWNLQQDAGRTFAEACATLKREKPGYAEMIDAWFGRYDEMMAGPIAGSVALLAQLRDQKVPISALSNWSAETFPFARKRFEFLRWFRAIVLSAEVHLVKPDPRIFQHFCEKVALHVAGKIKGTHPDFRYQVIAEPEELGDGGRVRWVSGRPGEAPAYAGTDFIVARDGRIAAVYLFFDKLPQTLK